MSEQELSEVQAMAVQRPPRYPYAWAWLFGTSQATGLAICVAGEWVWGVLTLLVAQGLSFWATLWPQSRLLSPVLVRLPTRERVVWLTIDDGPSDDTLAILDLLDTYAAKACFFVVAERAQQYPQVVREIQRRGHELGNHSLNHPQQWFWALPPRAMRAQISDAQKVLGDLTGSAPRWFRAVVGMANPFVAAPLSEHQLTRVAWSARGFDTRCADPATVVARIERSLSPGAIVLMHENAPHGGSVATLAALLQRLQTLGYRCIAPP